MISIFQNVLIIDTIEKSEKKGLFVKSLYGMPNELSEIKFRKEVFKPSAIK